jgi:hypothetical protein
MIYAEIWTLRPPEGYRHDSYEVNVINKRGVTIGSRTFHRYHEDAVKWAESFFPGQPWRMPIKIDGVPRRDVLAL